MVFYTYDKTGNVLTADYAGEQTETNTYNELGLLTTVTTAEGDTLYQYDDASRLISVTQPNGETVSYTYDSHGNRASMTYPNGKTVKYSYDDMNRLIAVKGVDGATTKYSYDALGRRIATDGAKEDTVYAYDEVGNLVSQTTTGAYDLALEYAYDLSGRMTQESRTENGATLTSSYIYDALGQLTSFTRSDGQSETYTYDPVGNMTAKTQNGVSTTMRYNAANQLTQSVTNGDTTTYSYDANGNLTRSGNAGGARSYAYNALNLLQSFTREDGYTETYSYNANRLLSEIRTSEDLTTTLTWDILYGDGVVISENQNGKTTNYTYGLERISAITGRTRTEYVYDGRGSVAAEVSYNNAWYTFGGGLARKNVVSKSYSPFGELLTEQASGFGYNGEYYNAATGMIYLRARFYEPEMNRFAQKDTLRGNIADGISLNRYLYCQSDPVNFADYNGLQMVNVCVADGGGSGNSSQKKTSIIDQVIAKASIAVSSAAVIAKNTIRNILNSNGSEELAPSIRGQSLTSESPGVRNVAVSLQSCFDPNVVIRDGNIITYMGKRYAIPSGSPIVNWTPDAVRRYIIPNQTPLPPTQQIANQATISKSDRVADGGLNLFGGALFTWLGAVAIDTALGVACPPVAIALAVFFGGSSVLYGGSMAAEGFNDIQLAYEGDTASIAFNPVRDTFFGGDQGMYDLFGSLSGMGSMGIVYSYPDLYGESTYSSYSQNIINDSTSETRYSPANPGPLNEKVANTFNGATYTKRILTEDTVMYRVHGGTANEVGSYMSVTPQNGGLQSQLDLALNPEWGNTAESVTRVIVPRGTIIYEGTAAPQNIYDSLGNVIGTLPGGGNQIYIPKVEEGWFVR